VIVPIGSDEGAADPDCSPEQHEPHRRREHETTNAATVRAERHPYADFTRSVGHKKRHHP
jgi:hypothetical protein